MCPFYCCKSNALCPTQEKSLLYHRISASGCKENAVFNVQIVTKNSCFQIMKTKNMSYAVRSVLVVSKIN